MPDARFRSLNDALRERFGEKLYKLALNGGCTCPNRDGTLGTRGCIFCSAGGSRASSQRILAFPSGNRSGTGSAAFRGKRPVQRYIAYFQAYTNTYGPIGRLRDMFMEAIAQPEIAVLSIATRPDCLGDEVLALLAELNERKPVWVELGLQTIMKRLPPLSGGAILFRFLMKPWKLWPRERSRRSSIQFWGCPARRRK